jgi:hypothetical protein
VERQFSSCIAPVSHEKSSIYVVSSVMCAQQLLGVRLALWRHKKRTDVTCVRLHTLSGVPKAPFGVERNGFVCYNLNVVVVLKFSFYRRLGARAISCVAQ